MLSFLKNLTLADNETIRTTAIRATKDRNPKEADLRIFKDGSIYPSESLVKEFGLEYVNKPAEGAETVPSFGFDVTDSREYSNTKSWPVALVLISIVDKTAPKVDLFGSCRYNEDGSPIGSVLDQGAATFGKTVLIPMLKEVYNVDVETAEKGYVDLQFVRDNGFTLPSGVYYLPKKVMRGEAAGQVKVQRRENITLFPLVPVSMLSGEAVEEKVEEAQEALVVETSTPEIAEAATILEIEDPTIDPIVGEDEEDLFSFTN